MQIKGFQDEYYYLSNFAHSPLVFDGIYYPTVEHAFQAMKTLDIEVRKSIASAESPSEAKKMGRRVELRPDWEEIKYQTMYSLVLEKFRQNPYLKTKLLNLPFDTEFEEGNYWHDNTWGNCYCDKCAKAEGKNWLGKILGDLRKQFEQYEN